MKEESKKMCGIVAYVGDAEAVPLLLEGLHALEERGYDSAGVAIVGRQAILRCCKVEGRIEGLAQKLAAEPLSGSIGIAHTRWATHGEPSEANAHPHRIGAADGDMYVASMPDAFCGRALRKIELRDGEVVSVRQGRHAGTIAPPTRIEADKRADRGDAPHWMIAEMGEQPEAIRRALNYGGRLDRSDGLAKLGGLDSRAKDLLALRVLRLTGCGSAYYAALYGRYLLARYGGFEAVEADLASEILEDHLRAGVGMLAISQSGETRDTYLAVSEAKRQGALTFSIVNRVGRLIARETGLGIYQNAGPEKAVASTKSFVSQLVILALITLWFSRHRGRLSRAEGQEVIQALEVLPDQIEEVLRLRGQIQELVCVYQHARNFLYLGRGQAYPIALEGALKLKEIAYLHAEGYAAGEMKHGPIALIDDRMPSVFVVPKVPGWQHTLPNMREIKARRGPVIAVATQGLEEVAEAADHVLTIPECHSWLAPILAVIPLQLFAYEMAVALGLDPDHPRNLAKSVTVE